MEHVQEAAHQGKAGAMPGFKYSCLPGPKRLLDQLRQKRGLIGPHKQADAHLGSALHGQPAEGTEGPANSRLDSASM